MQAEAQSVSTRRNLGWKGDWRRPAGRGPGREPGGWREAGLCPAGQVAVSQAPLLNLQAGPGWPGAASGPACGGPGPTHRGLTPVSGPGERCHRERVALDLLCHPHPAGLLLHLLIRSRGNSINGTPICSPYYSLLFS